MKRHRIYDFRLRRKPLGLWKNSLTKAVNALTGLLDTNDSRLKQLVCNDIIDNILQRKEIGDLAKRIEAIE
jgi:hypothetical protein